MNEKDCSLNSIENVLKCFNRCLENYIPENKIYLSPLIKRITKTIYNLYEIRFYNVSFIIIRGVIDDIQKTIDSIIESSYLPLTIFIVGVGKNDYKPMKKIFSTDHKSSLGMEKMRNNVLFTSLIDDFSNDAEKLVSWCFEELAKQIISFYDLIKSSPRHIYENNVKNIETSFNLYNSSICLESSQNINESDIKELNLKLSEIRESKNSIFNYSTPCNPCDEEINNKKVINPYSSDANLSNLSDLSYKNDNNIINEKTSVSSQRFVNQKPTPYLSVIDMKDNTNDVNKESDDINTPKGIYTPNPTPNPSIKLEIIRNPYSCGKQEENKNIETPGDPTDYQNTLYNIPNKSIIDPNQDTQVFNPYAKVIKKPNKRNVEQSKNSMELKKMNNNSNGSDFNSTKNSENNVKSSNYFLFNNNYSIDSSLMK